MKQQVYNLAKDHINNISDTYEVLYVHFDGFRSAPANENCNNPTLFLLFSVLLDTKQTCSIGIRFNMDDEEGKDEYIHFIKNSANCELNKNDSLLYTDISYISDIDVVSTFTKAKTDKDTTYDLICADQGELIRLKFKYYQFVMIEDICKTIFKTQFFNFIDLELIKFSDFYFHISNMDAPIIRLHSDMQYEVSHIYLNKKDLLDENHYRSIIIIKIDSGNDKLCLALEIPFFKSKNSFKETIKMLTSKGIIITDNINEIAKYLVTESDRNYYMINYDNIVTISYKKNEYLDYNTSMSKYCFVANKVEGVCDKCYIEMYYMIFEEIMNIVSF